MSESSSEEGMMVVSRSDAGKVDYLFAVGRPIVVNRVGKGDGVGGKVVGAAEKVGECR